MKVQDLITYLQEYCKPSDEVSAVNTQYDGGSDISELHDPALVVGYDKVIIVANTYYDVHYAQSMSNLFCTVWPNGNVT